jgi:hypothetical protein
LSPKRNRDAGARSFPFSARFASLAFLLPGLAFPLGSAVVSSAAKAVNATVPQSGRPIGERRQRSPGAEIAEKSPSEKFSPKTAKKFRKNFQKNALKVAQTKRVLPLVLCKE